MQFGSVYYQRKRARLINIPPSRALDVIKAISENRKSQIPAALSALQYVTGARVGEAARFTKNSIIFQDKERVRISMFVEKKRVLAAKRTVPVPISGNCKTMENLAWDRYIRPLLEISDDSAMVLKPWGNMAEYVLRNSPTFDFLAEMPDGREVTITRKLHSHFWRAVRSSHLVDYYGFDSFRLKEYFNWADTRPSEAYVRLKDTEKALGLGILSSTGSLPAPNLPSPEPPSSL